MSKVKPIPDGVPVVMPMLVCRDAVAAIDFCKTSFGAIELARRPGPDGTVAHAALTIGGAMILIEGEWPTLASRAPQPDGSSPVVIYVYVEDVDKVIERAVAAGARVLLPVKNQFWGIAPDGLSIRRGTCGPSPHASKRPRPGRGRNGGPAQPRVDVVAPGR